MRKIICASCRGDLTDATVNTVFWCSLPIDLCDSCLALGSRGCSESLSKSQVDALLKARANPRMNPLRVRKNLERYIEECYGSQEQNNQQGGGSTLPNKEERENGDREEAEKDDSTGTDAIKDGGGSV